MIKLLGAILIMCSLVEVLDSVLSLFLVLDRRFLWQVGRLFRLVLALIEGIIGIILLIVG